MSEKNLKKVNDYLINDDDSSAEPRQFMSDLLHVPGSHFTGPRTHLDKDKQAVDQTDEIARHHDLDYAKGRNRGEADNHFIGEMMADRHNPWTASMGALGIGMAQLVRALGIDITQTAAPSSRISKQGTNAYKRFLKEQILPPTLPHTSLSKVTVNIARIILF